MSKKAAEPAPKPLLGRFSSHLKMGIVGLPNVGKSTLFNTLTKMSVPAENFPFCTIDPTEARVAVPDERFKKLCEHYKPVSRVQAFLTVTDIAGLVKGASKGEGLGNAFLSHIRAVDGIFHVVRIFEDAEITHVEGNIDPVRDMEIITEELLLKDVEMLEKHCTEFDRTVVRVDKTKKADHEIMMQVLKWVRDDKKEVRLGDWSAKQIEVINTLPLLTAKPVVVLVNMTAADYAAKKSKWLGKIKAFVDAHGCSPIVPFCGRFEADLGALESDAEKEKLSAERQMQSAIPKIVKTGFQVLDLIYFFTAGEDEVRAWTIRKSTKAPQAAGAIHTDFERGFICAEVMSFEDWSTCGSESACRAQGKYTQRGREYIVQDGDICFFKFNTGGGSKKK